MSPFTTLPERQSDAAMRASVDERARLLAASRNKTTRSPATRIASGVSRFRSRARGRRASRHWRNSRTCAPHCSSRRWTSQGPFGTRHMRMRRYLSPARCVETPKNFCVCGSKAFDSSRAPFAFAPGGRSCDPCFGRRRRPPACATYVIGAFDGRHSLDRRRRTCTEQRRKTRHKALLYGMYVKAHSSQIGVASDAIMRVLLDEARRRTSRS